jgi:hypothetical protein
LHDQVWDRTGKNQERWNSKLFKTYGTW